MWFLVKTKLIDPLLFTPLGFPKSLCMGLCEAPRALLNSSVGGFVKHSYIYIYVGISWSPLGLCKAPLYVGFVKPLCMGTYKLSLIFVGKRIQMYVCTYVNTKPSEFCEAPYVWEFAMHPLYRGFARLLSMDTLWRTNHISIPIYWGFTKSPKYRGLKNLHCMGT